MGVLADVRDPIGPDNEKYLLEIIADSDILVACWGNISKVPESLHPRFKVVTEMLVESGKRLLCFGTTKHGHPRHPARLPYNTKLVNFDRDGVDNGIQ